MENIIKVVPHSSNGKDYEIKVSRILNGFSVRAFLGGKPSNSNIYKLENDELLGENIGMSNLEVEPLDRLIQIVKDDIDKGYGIPLPKNN